MAADFAGYPLFPCLKYTEKILMKSALLLFLLLFPAAVFGVDVESCGNDDFIFDLNSDSFLACISHNGRYIQKREAVTDAEVIKLEKSLTKKSSNKTELKELFPTLKNLMTDYAVNYGCTNGVQYSVTDNGVIDVPIVKNLTSEKGLAISRKYFNGISRMNVQNTAGVTKLMKYLGTEFAVGSKEITAAQNMLDSEYIKVDYKELVASNNTSKLALYQSVLRVCDQTKEEFYIAVEYAETIPDCGGNFTFPFANNKSELDQVTLEADPNYLKFKACLENGLKKGLEIDTVHIKASASQFNNDPLSSGCSARDFKCLSMKRAKSAQDFIATLVGKVDIPDDKASQAKDKIAAAILDTNGQNCDGSSGPCPYDSIDKSGRWQMVQSVDRDSYDKYKYVKARLHFKPASTKLSGSFYMALRYSCSNFTFSCAPDPAASACK